MFNRRVLFILSYSNYLLITRPDNWEKLKNDTNKVWPVNARNSRLFNSFKVGDIFIVYLSKKSSFAGIVEISGNLESPKNPVLFMGDFYEYLLPVEYKVVLKNDQLIKIRDLIDELELTKNRTSTYGSCLQRAAKKISNADFELIRSRIMEGTILNN